MDMIQAMRARHTVRQYLDKPIPSQVVEQLEKRLEADNRQQGTAISLVTEDSSALGLSAKLVRAKGVRNYFIMSGDAGAGSEGVGGLDLDYRLGYAGADLMLYAQTLGLNTWWVAPITARLWPGWRKAIIRSESSRWAMVPFRASRTIPSVPMR